jgi:hypothetical protein
MVAQRIKETLLKQQEEQRRFENQRALSAEGLNERKFGESTRQFDAGLGLDKDKFGESVRQFDTSLGFDQQKWGDMAPQRDADVAQTGAQTWNIYRQPEKEATDRSHESGLVDQRGRWNLREIGASGAEQRKTKAAPEFGVSGASQAIREANEIDDSLRLISQLENDPALATAVGPLDGRGLGQVRDLEGTTRFQALHDQLVGRLQLAQAGKLKGQGQISDKERAMLMAAATALTRKMGEGDYKAELAKVRQQFERMPRSMMAPGGQAQINLGGFGQIDAPNADPKVGDIKTYPNGNKARFDGQGWELIK